MSGWTRLQQGNTRFVEGRSQARTDAVQRAELVDGQKPFALVLGCSDSRVSTETLFDEGLGELFVVRTAGHVLDDAVLGSIEYGVGVLGVETLLVLGHESCGAVAAAASLVAGGPPPGGYVRFVAESIAAGLPAEGDLVGRHARNVLVQLAAVSSVVREAEFLHGLELVAATYSLADGRVRAAAASRPAPVKPPLGTAAVQEETVRG